MAPNNKSGRHALAALLIVVAAAAAILGQAPRGVEAQGTILNITAVNISGIVPCAAGININPVTAPGFPNASVQLVCGNTVVTTVTTSSTGAFAINLGTLANLVGNATGILTSLLGSQCRVAVTTPLAACNVNLAGVVGTLTAPVQLLSSTVAGQSGGLLSLVTGLFSLL